SNATPIPYQGLIPNTVLVPITASNTRKVATSCVLEFTTLLGARLVTSPKLGTSSAANCAEASGYRPEFCSHFCNSAYSIGPCCLTFVGDEELFIRKLKIACRPLFASCQSI